MEEVKKSVGTKKSTSSKNKKSVGAKKSTSQNSKKIVKKVDNVKKNTKSETKVDKKVSAKASSKINDIDVKVETKEVVEKKLENTNLDEKNNDVNTEKKGNEVFRTVAICAVLVVLVGLTFIVGINRNKGKYLYQTHVGIKDVTVSEYLDIISKDDTSIIYIGRPGCGYCQMFLPILTNVLNKYKIGVEYVNIESISTEDEWNNFNNSNEYLSAGEWGTPTLIVYKSGKIVDVNPGYVEESKLIDFLVKNELIKGE